MRPPATVLRNGRGMRTVLIHGAFGSPRFWTGPLPRTLRCGRVVAYPLPVHGDWHPSPGELGRLLHPHRLADSYADAIRRDFAGQPVNIVGHSTGAFVATAIAARHPQVVQRIALVGGFLDGSCAGSENFLREMVLKSRYAPTVLDGFLKAWTATPTTFRIGMANLIESWDQTKRCDDFEGICERVRLDLKNANSRNLQRVLKWLSQTRIWDQAADIRARPLVVGGRRDRVVSFTHQRQVAAHLGCPISSIEGVGHLPMVEHPKWFAHVIDSWASARS